MNRPLGFFLVILCVQGLFAILGVWIFDFHSFQILAFASVSMGEMLFVLLAGLSLESVRHSCEFVHIWRWDFGIVLCDLMIIVTLRRAWLRSAQQKRKIQPVSMPGFFPHVSSMLDTLFGLEFF